MSEVRERLEFPVVALPGVGHMAAPLSAHPNASIGD